MFAAEAETITNESNRSAILLRTERIGRVLNVSLTWWITLLWMHFIVHIAHCDKSRLRHDKYNQRCACGLREIEDKVIQLVHEILQIARALHREEKGSLHHGTVICLIISLDDCQFSLYGEKTFVFWLKLQFVSSSSLGIKKTSWESLGDYVLAVHTHKSLALIALLTVSQAHSDEMHSA